MYDTYVVQANDTIDSIASKYNTSKEVLEMLNGYNLDIIPGNSIMVPRVSNRYFDYYTVTKGDTIFMGNNE